MNKTRVLTINAILIALLLVMSLVPFIGFIQIGPVAITLTHIPVIIGAIALGPVSGAILGLTFGVGSWLAAVFRAATPIDLLFVNPLVAILPRLLFGVLVAYLWKGLMLFSTENKTSKASLTAFLGTLGHTLFVLVTLFLAMKMDTSDAFTSFTQGGLWLFLVSTFTINAMIESILALYFSVAILKALGVIPRQENKPTFIPRPLVSANQIVIVVSVLIAWVLQSPYYLLVPIIVGSLGFFFDENPVMVFAKQFLKKPFDQYTPEDPSAQRFSQGIALTLLVFAFVAWLFGWNVLANIALTLVIIAATVALLGFCIGCFIYLHLSYYKQRKKSGN